MTNDAERAAKAYAAATSEAQAQDYLARELRRFKWTVEVEPYCRTARGDIRRADLLCIGRGRTVRGEEIGAVVAVEIKHDWNGMHNGPMMEGGAQVADYIGATAWTSAEGLPLPFPDAYALTTSWLLAGAPPITSLVGQVSDFADMRMVHERVLWAAGGCLLLRERPNGDLTASRWAIEPVGRGGKLTRTRIKMTDWWGGR